MLSRYQQLKRRSPKSTRDIQELCSGLIHVGTVLSSTRACHGYMAQPCCCVFVHEPPSFDRTYLDVDGDGGHVETRGTQKPEGHLFIFVNRRSISKWTYNRCRPQVLCCCHFVDFRIPKCLCIPHNGIPPNIQSTHHFMTISTLCPAKLPTSVTANL